MHDQPPTRTERVLTVVVGLAFVLLFPLMGAFFP